MHVHLILKFKLRVLKHRCNICKKKNILDWIVVIMKKILIIQTPILIFFPFLFPRWLLFSWQKGLFVFISNIFYFESKFCLAQNVLSALFLFLRRLFRWRKENYVEKGRRLFRKKNDVVWRWNLFLSIFLYTFEYGWFTIDSLHFLVINVERK